MHETYVIDQPWILLVHPVSDAEADANGGRSRIVFECCICGQTETLEFVLPAKDDPVWRLCDPQTGLPEYYQHRLKFQQAHLHPDRQGHPVLTWARPLRNPAALPGGLNLEELAERLRRDIAAANERN